MGSGAEHSRGSGNTRSRDLNISSHDFEKYFFHNFIAMTFECMWYAMKNGFRNEIVLISVSKRYPVMVGVLCELYLL